MSAGAFSQHPEVGMQPFRFGIHRDGKHVCGIVGFITLIPQREEIPLFDSLGDLQILY
jgi:hypothetical protein